MNSLAAVVAQVIRNGKSKTITNSQAIIAIVSEKRIVLIIIRGIIPLTYLEIPIISKSEIADCATPKTKSIHPNPEKNKFVINTPTIIPQKYFLLKTIRWLKISGILNCNAINPIGATIIPSTTYSAAIIAFTVKIFIFIIFPPSFFTWDGMNEPRVAILPTCYFLIFGS
ncbi:membrane protein [Listeria monocytogenes]|nr:hypothetical protein BN389_08960 [Listeria monocytogenes serotype 4b str. LL195]GAM91839.1 membrane protein [Listeria monocytogenes]GAM94596.1 membrane protein [Listeria monocytogenes]GAT36126.1 membrane protein [Listeria monocytogenes]GAT37970.1 membrane protein [Listeria monocytogenes]